MAILNAFPMHDGLQVFREVGADKISCSLIFPDHPDWLEAVAAAGASAPSAVEAPTETVVSARANAISAINAVRGEVRRRFITDIPGQQMVYLEKEFEARGWVSARSAAAAGATEQPDLIGFPHIAAEIGTTAPDADGVAQVYLNLAAQFRTISATIEGAVMRALATVDAAQSPVDIATVAANFPTSLLAALRAEGVSI